MSQHLDLDVNNYTHAEIFALFSLDPHECTMAEAEAKTTDALIQVAESQDYTQFFTRCREIMTRKIGERTKPHNTTEMSNAATAYRPLQPLQQQNTLNINYSTQPSNYNAFHRESEVNEGGAYAKRNIPPVVNAYNYEYPTGVINPIERRVIQL
jgi:hypothetical protein